VKTAQKSENNTEEDQHKSQKIRLKKTTTG